MKIHLEAEEYRDWTEKFNKNFNSRLNQAEERIRKLSNRSLEINQGEKRQNEWKKVSDESL